jgi:hypothetical protein
MASDPIPGLPSGLTIGPLTTALNDRLRRINVALNEVQPAPTTQVSAPVLYGTHANRIAKAVPADATIYVETDRGNVVYQVQATVWTFIGGQMAAAWASMPADLGKADEDFVFTDNVNSLHIWQWNGSAWTWGPGDRHSGEFGQFDSMPGTGWHLCDGSTNQTKYAGDGTRVTNFTVPDQRGFYLQANGSYTGNGVAAAAPGLSGSTAVGVASIPPVNTASASAVIAGSTAVDTGLGGTVQAGTGANVALHNHVHGIGSIADSGHVHSVTPVDAGHVHGQGTLAVDATATPPTFAVLPYYRL